MFTIVYPEARMIESYVHTHTYIHNIIIISYLFAAKKEKRIIYPVVRVGCHNELPTYNIWRHFFRPLEYLHVVVGIVLERHLIKYFHVNIYTRYSRL